MAPDGARWAKPLREGEILLHVLEISFGNERGLTEVTLTLAGLLLENVPLALFPSQNLAGAGYFKAFSNRLPSFGFSCSASHGARRLAADSRNSRDFW